MAPLLHLSTDNRWVKGISLFSSLQLHWELLIKIHHLASSFVVFLSFGNWLRLERFRELFQDFCACLTIGTYSKIKKECDWWVRGTRKTDSTLPTVTTLLTHDYLLGSIANATSNFIKIGSQVINITLIFSFFSFGKLIVIDIGGKSEDLLLWSQPRLKSWHFSRNIIIWSETNIHFKFQIWSWNIRKEMWIERIALP